MTTTMPKVHIQLSTEPSYWGSLVTSEQAVLYCERLQGALKSQFGDEMDLSFEWTDTPVRGGILCDNDDALLEVFQWIQDNWTLVF